jgi:hypothetical protein
MRVKIGKEETVHIKDLSAARWAKHEHPLRGAEQPRMKVWTEDRLDDGLSGIKLSTRFGSCNRIL